MDFIVANPGLYLKLLLNKARYFLSGAEYSNMYYLGFERSQVTRTLHIPFVNFYLVLPFFLVGIVAAASHWRELFWPYAMVGMVLLTTLLFFHDDRFRLPMIPFAILLAAYGIWAVMSAIRGGRRALILTVFVVALGLNMGLCTMERGKYDPAHQLHTMIGELYYSQGKLGSAMDSFRRAVRLNPRDWSPKIGMMKIHFAQGRVEQAAQMYRKAMGEVGGDIKRLMLQDPELVRLRRYVEGQANADGGG